MRRLNSTLRVFIQPGRCWGRIIGEDSDQGACRLCIETCPEVFEKPLADQCAHVRPGANPTSYVTRVRQAAEICPVDAIQLAEDTDRLGI